MTDAIESENKKTPAEQEQELELDRQLKESFPASDVPAAIQPSKHSEDKDK